jgi:hypothetical protein
MPEGEEFHTRRIPSDAVVDVIADAAKKDATHSRQTRVACHRSDSGMKR